MYRKQTYVYIYVYVFTYDTREYTEYTAGRLATISIWYTILQHGVQQMCNYQTEKHAQTNKQTKMYWGCDKPTKSRWCQIIGLKGLQTGLTQTWHKQTVPCKTKETMNNIAGDAHAVTALIIILASIGICPNRHAMILWCSAKTARCVLCWDILLPVHRHEEVCTFTFSNHNRSGGIFSRAKKGDFLCIPWRLWKRCQVKCGTFVLEISRERPSIVGQLANTSSISTWFHNWWNAWFVNQPSFETKAPNLCIATVASFPYHMNT